MFVNVRWLAKQALHHGRVACGKTDRPRPHPSWPGEGPGICPDEDLQLGDPPVDDLSAPAIEDEPPVILHTVPGPVIAEERLLKHIAFGEGIPQSVLALHQKPARLVEIQPDVRMPPRFDEHPS